jgi:uncharacterized protein YeaO (DUF488 family)
MLATARNTDFASQRGTLIEVAQSSFALSTVLLRQLARGDLDEASFAERYAEELRQQWTRNPLPFGDVIAQAKRGDVTLVDTWRPGPHAPRRVLAGILARLARRDTSW